MQLRTLKAFVEGYVFAEAVAACEKAQSSTPFKWNGGTSTSVIGLNSVKLDKIHGHCQLHAGRRQRLLRLRSDQEERPTSARTSWSGSNDPAMPSMGWDRHEREGSRRTIEFCRRRPCGTISRACPISPRCSAARRRPGRSARSATAISTSSSSCKGTSGGIAVKQALPYVRLVGESWPLPLSRAHYEYLALTAAGAARARPGAGGAAPRRGAGADRDGAARAAHHHAQGADRGDRLSALRRRHHDLHGADAVLHLRPRAVRPREKKEGIAAFAGNHALCKITEDLIFTDPYRHRRAEPLDRAVARRDRRGACATTWSCTSRSPG